MAAIDLGLDGLMRRLPGSLHRHTQSTPSALWLVNHNLGYTPLVQVFTVGGVLIANITVIHLNDNQFNVIPDSPLVGFTLSR